MPATTVVVTCECGCPTIGLAVGGRVLEDKWKNGVYLAQFEGTTPEGVYVEVLIFASQGQLVELEVCKIMGGEEKCSLPLLDALTLRPSQMKRR